MLSKKDLPFDVTNRCYIGIYHTDCCLFYRGVPIINVQYPFWTEDIHVAVGYIDNGVNSDTGEIERGYSLLVDVPLYDEKIKLDHFEHIYYGLFRSMSEIEDWLENPCLLY